MATAAARSVFERVDHFVEMLLYYLAALLLIGVAVAVFYNVVLRYAFNSPALWSEDVPRVFQIWMTYLAVAVATKRGQNIRVTVIIDKFRPRPRLILEVFMHILVLIMVATMIWFNFPVLELTMRGRMLSTGWPNAVSFIPVSVGGVFIFLYQSSLILRSIRAYRAGVSQREVGG